MLKKLFHELRTMPRFIYFLAAITVFGLAVGAYRMYVGLGDTTNLSKDFPWGIWISFDLATVALSGGAFTLAALVYVFQLEALHPAVRPTVLAGLLGYSSVLVVLLFDLGRWDRFYNVFLHPNFSSALLEVSWCIAAYSTILFYELSPVLLEMDAHDHQKIHDPHCDRGGHTVHHAPIITGNDVRHHVRPVAPTLVLNAAARIFPG